MLFFQLNHNAEHGKMTINNRIIIDNAFLCTPFLASTSVKNFLVKNRTFNVCTRSMLTLTSSKGSNIVTKMGSMFPKNLFGRSMTAFHGGNLDRNDLQKQGFHTDQKTFFVGDVSGCHDNAGVAVCNQEKCKTTNCADAKKTAAYHQAPIQNDPDITYKFVATLTSNAVKKPHLNGTVVDANDNVKKQGKPQEAAMEKSATTLKDVFHFNEKKKLTDFLQENNHTNAMLPKLPHDTFQK